MYVGVVKTREMFKLRIVEIARELGIKNLHTYLLKHGFSKHYATQLSLGRSQKLDLALLYKLCQTFKCPLNELVMYVPKDEQELLLQPYLREMVRTDGVVDVKAKLETLDHEKRKLLLAFLERL
jgi:DNA-binding Xre family transcriptional regulator